MPNQVQAGRTRLGGDNLLLPLLAVAALIAISVVRFASSAPGEELFAILPIALLGMMFGARGGLVAALFAAIVFIVWALNHNVATLEDIDEPLAFFILGAITGFYGHGALGDYDLGRQRLRRRIRLAIARGEIVMHYQPMVTAGGETVAVEALARWQPPDGELIPPLAFIPAAEADPNTIRAFTLHTFDLAATYATENLAESRIRVAVNLSPAVLGGGRIPGELGRILRRTGLPPERLDIEITEAAFAEGGEEEVATAIEGIKRLGVGMVMLDDFGVGHSSLARLGALEIDALKIDRELVAGWERPEYEAVIRSIVELAHGLNLTVIAEGVEDARTEDSLRELGCDAVQGFHLSPPLPGDELPSWLRAASPA